MKLSRKIKHYGRSLFQVARDRDILREVDESLKAIAQLLRKEADIRAIFMAHRISPSQKDSLFRQALSDVIDPVTLEFFLLMMDNRLSVSEVLAVVTVYHRLLRAELGEEDLTVFCAHPLDEDDINAIVRELEERTSTVLRWNTVVDPSLIGGIKFRVGNTFLDGTIARRIQLLKTSLLSNN
ncbi:MAG: ATP synthase F1 subunit delta [Fidelibacterota bacterium]